MLKKQIEDYLLTEGAENEVAILCLVGGEMDLMLQEVSRGFLAQFAGEP